MQAIRQSPTDRLLWGLRVAKLSRNDLKSLALLGYEPALALQPADVKELELKGAAAYKLLPLDLGIDFVLFLIDEIRQDQQGKLVFFDRLYFNHIKSALKESQSSEDSKRKQDYLTKATTLIDAWGLREPTFQGSPLGRQYFKSMIEALQGKGPHSINYCAAILVRTWLVPHMNELYCKYGVIPASRQFDLANATKEALSTERAYKKANAECSRLTKDFFVKFLLRNL